MKMLALKGSQLPKSTSHFKLVAFSAIIFVFAVVFASVSMAQSGMNGKRSGGWGKGNKYDRMYDTKTVETIRGEVINVEKVIPIKGMSTGVYVMIKNTNEIISVHLGPEWFIDKQDIEIKLKDKLEIKGSRISYSGKPAIIAAEIIKGDEIIVLRDENGTPVWGGWRRR